MLKSSVILGFLLGPGDIVRKGETKLFPKLELYTNISFLSKGDGVIFRSDMGVPEKLCQ